MLITYDNKKHKKDILEKTSRTELKTVSGKRAKNKLIHADNLSALKTLLDDYSGKVDLIYIDPPFATNGHFKISDDRANTISSSNGDAIAYSDTLIGVEFLEFLRERLIFLRELLSERGSIYLHIGYKIGHYVKLIMDEVFGRDMFRNDITRIKCNPKNFHRKAYGNIKDLILFYSKAESPIWNDPRVPFTEEDKERLFKKLDKSGRQYTTIPLHAPGETSNGNTSKEWKGMKPPKGRHWRTDPAILDQWDQQELIEWSSNEGGLVLDCFCGSGTTLVAAQLLNRNWIGIDQSEPAIKVAQKRLGDLPSSLFSKSEYEFLRHKPVKIL